MDENDWLAARFEEQQAHLRSVAYRMFGSLAEAHDAVQNSWLRLSSADAADVENLGGWLTTVVSRECLRMLRSRREQPLADILVEPPAEEASDPEAQAPDRRLAKNIRRSGRSREPQRCLAAAHRTINMQYYMA